MFIYDEAIAAASNFSASTESSADGEGEENFIVNEMDDDRKNIYYNERQLVNIHAEKEDSELVMTSFYYRYIFWFIIMIMILITTARYMSNIDVDGDLMVISVTIAIGILIILYKRYDIS